ncbi:MAG: TMEM175 family protein, partial [Actinomycetia bacterium]|nr:TMEM175 family protein [Actinomycetes bacterium]
LGEIRPTFVAFIISFLLVGMYWVGHRSSFAQVQYIDRNTIWLNLLFLLPVSLVPFASAVLGNYQSEPTALHIYGLVLIAVTVLRMVLDVYLSRHPGLLWQQSDGQVRRLVRITAGAPLVVYVIAMTVAIWIPWLSLLLYFSIPLLYFVLVTVLKSDPRTRVSAEDLS